MARWLAESAATQGRSGSAERSASIVSTPSAHRQHGLRRPEAYAVAVQVAPRPARGSERRLADASAGEVGPLQPGNPAGQIGDGGDQRRPLRAAVARQFGFRLQQRKGRCIGIDEFRLTQAIIVDEGDGRSQHWNNNAGRAMPEHRQPRGTSGYGEARTANDSVAAIAATQSAMRS